MRDQIEVPQDKENKFQVCHGLTDEERREIRKSQRLLRKEIPDLDIEEARARNNEIHEKVRYIRESVLDADNLDDIAKKATIKVEQMVQAPRYDAENVIRRLIEHCRVTKGGDSYFDWKGLGVQAGVCFNAVPSQVSFLNGPLVDGNEEVTVKQRAKRTRHTQTESDAEEERPEDIKGHTARGADKLSAVQQNIEDVRGSLKKKVDRAYTSKRKKIEKTYGKDSIPANAKKKLKKNSGVCAVELLFNPKSFTQTVENLYHYSFLVKEGKASLKLRQSREVVDNESGIEVEGGPVANYKKDSETKIHPKPRQAIVSLTMEDWKALVQAYDVKKSDVKHREP